MRTLFRSRIAPWTSLALLFILSIFARAQDTGTNQVPDLTDMSLEKLMDIEVPKVYGASKFEQKTTEAPSSITIVGSDEIKRYGYRTLAEVLKSVQGFYVSSDRNYAFLGARGVSLGDFNSRILLLVDGHRVNNNLNDGAPIGTEFILDVDLIDRVEVIRGPGSVLYGNNAFFGVINVITRQGKQLNGVESSAEYGTFDTYKVRATYGKLFTNGIQLMLSGTYYQSDGEENLFYPEFNTPANNNGIAHRLDDDTYGSFFGSLGYKDFTLEGAYNRREKANPTAQFITTFNDDHLHTTDERSYTSLKYSHSFPDVVDVTAQVYYDRNDYGIIYPTGDPVATAFFHEKQVGEWWGTEIQLNKRLWDRHTITLGAEYRDDFRQGQRIFDSTTTYTDNNRSRESHGVYIQGDFTIRTNLHFNGGVRYDQYGNFDPTYNPRLALIYNPFEKSTFKVLYGQAFRAPNFLELSDPRFQDIKPEEITSYELVYEQEITKGLRTSLSGFINDMDDLIVLENGAFTNFNAQTKGIEMALEGSWTNGIRTRLSYSLQETENKSSGNDIPDSPNHLIKANVSVPIIYEKVFFGVEWQYTSSRHSLFTTTTGATVPGSDAGGFGILNLTLFSQDIVKNLEASASIYNFLDRHYSDPASRFHQQDLIGQDGRTFRVKLTYHF